MIIVGYSQSALDNDYGAVMLAPQFSNISGKAGLAIENLKPVAADEEVDLAGNVEIQLLTSAGETDIAYVWTGEEWDGAEGVTIEPGQGLWVGNYTGETVGLQSAGQVPTDDVSIDLDLDYGAVAAGNSFPVAVALADIFPTAEEGIDLAGNVEIQILTTAGETDVAYVWTGDGWDGDDGVTFDPGQGLWVGNYTGEAVQLVIPAPEIK